MSPPNLPKRTQQQKNESDSFAIILYKLKEIGIFRNMTQSDFGIDFEIETVTDNMVEGHCIKVQLKSKISNLLRKDGHAKIGGIKLSTLYYWAELSYNTPVIAMAVDLEDGKDDIYISDPLFWQTINHIETSRSVLNEKNEHVYPTRTIELGIHRSIPDNLRRLRKIAASVGLREFIYAHKWILHNFRKICEILEDAIACDRHIPCNNPIFFENLLEHLDILVKYNDIASNSNERILLPSYQACKQQSNWDDPYNDVVYNVFKNSFMPILTILRKYKHRILNSAAYWLNKDVRYLKLVFMTDIPDCNKFEEFADYCIRGYTLDNKKHNEFIAFALKKARQTGLEDIDVCSIFND